MNPLRWIYKAKTPELAGQTVALPRLSSAFLPQMPEGCTCTWDLARNGQPVRTADPQCQADHDGRQDPRQRMRGLRQ